jgi:type IV secretory pathway VirB10-like protein
MVAEQSQEDTMPDPITPEAPQTPATPAEPVAPPAAPEPPATPPAEPKTFDEAYVQTLRQEAAANRTKARDAETAAEERINKILEAAGIKPKDEPLDAGKLTEQLSAKDQTIRKLSVERALDKAARKNGADEDLLAAVLNHQGKLGELDPTAENFTDALDALVKTAVESNPKLKTVRATGASGVELTGGTGEQGQITEAQLARMNPDQIVEAQNKGLLRNLLG